MTLNGLQDLKKKRLFEKSLEKGEKKRKNTQNLLDAWVASFKKRLKGAG